MHKDYRFHFWKLYIDFFRRGGPLYGRITWYGQFFFIEIRKERFGWYRLIRIGSKTWEKKAAPHCI